MHFQTTCEASALFPVGDEPSDDEGAVEPDETLAEALARIARLEAALASAGGSSSSASQMAPPAVPAPKELAAEHWSQETQARCAGANAKRKFVSFLSNQFSLLSIQASQSSPAGIPTEELEVAWPLH
jgi:hypothetical protein